MKTFSVNFFFISFFLLIPIFGQSQVINVFSGDSIQDSIDIAEDGDTIIVANGIYEESLEISGKAIVLASNFLMTGDELDKENTIIIGDTENAISFFDGGNGLLVGFTITNNFSNNLRRNILCDNASPIILQNIIKEGVAGGMFNPQSEMNQWGGGILIKKGNPIIAINRIVDNFASQFGGGIAVNCGSPLIIKNIIETNESDTGGGIFCNRSDAIIIGNIIDNNYIDNDPGGGGIYLGNSYDKVLYNTIVNNHHDSPPCCGAKGGGIMISINSYAEVKFNIIVKNITDFGGGGLYCIDSAVPFSCDTLTTADSLNNIIEGNLFFENASVFSNPDDILLEGICTASNNIFNIDPLFVDFNNQNYELQPNSIADSLGLGHTAAPSYILDFDRDGRSDSAEITIVPFTNPLISDSDVDGVLDWEEIHTYDTEPSVKDSDSDMHSDGFEILMGTNPNDPLEFPDTIKQVTFDTLINKAIILSQNSFSVDTVPFVPILDFPQHGQENETGLVFNELGKIEVTNPLDSGFLFFPVRPRGSLDSVPIIVYTDNNNDQFYDIVRYEDLQASYEGMCPPVNKDLIPIAGKTISRFEIGAEQSDGTFPTLATFSATGYGRLLPYIGEDKQVYGVSQRLATHFLGDTITPEKFPRVKEVYLNMVDSFTAKVMATVDGESFSGAVSNSFTPGEFSEMKVKAHFFPRDTLKKNTFGVLGMSSMFWQGEDATPGNPMDEAHDSDILIVGYDTNNDRIVDLIIEETLENPGICNPQIETDFDSLSQGQQVYFALEQRDRDSLHYGSFPSANYHFRPSYSVSIISSNVPLSLKLLEFGTNGEFSDNIALAFIVKDNDIPPGEEIVVEYLLRAYFPNDTDEDGLNDHLERLIGTCVDNANTDEDNKSDYEELIEGTNPRTGIVIQASLPTIINAIVDEVIEETIQFTNLANCSATTPIFGIALQIDNEFSIIDTIGSFSECPYLIAEDGTFSLDIEFISAISGTFFDTLVVTLADTVIHIPLMAIVLPVGVNKIENSKSVKIFPNPSNGNVTIYLERWTGEITMKLIDIQGRILKQATQNNGNQQTFEIQINEIPKGNYLLELSNDKFHAIKKLIIQ